MKKEIFVELTAALLMILFLYTGISKLSNYIVFKEQIAESPLLAKFSPYIAIILPLSEFGVALALIVPKWRLKGLFASVILLIFFTGYIIAILQFDEHIPCSCGGIISLLSWKEHIVFNSMFIILGSISILLEKTLIEKNNLI